IPAGDFACEQSEQCSRLAGGVCQADGRCSYPDDSCASGQRYSTYAGDVAGACVSEDGEGSTTTGPLPESCDAVDCGGAGTCVMVDDLPTCACAPGLYAVGLACVEDPCDAVACWFLDAELGDDAADGSRDAPWRSIARLEQALPQASPGDHFLLRRGQRWEGQLDIGDVRGGLDAPVVVGAYGPLDEPRPMLRPGAVRVIDAEQLVVRDLWIEDDATVAEPPNRPCVMVIDSREVVIQGNVVTGCINRGIRVGNGSTYTVIVDNQIFDLAARAGVFVADATWAMPPEYVGPHHWIIDNVVTGIPESGITVNAANATTDVKVVGNRVADVTQAGVSVTGGGWAWAVGNVIARAGDEAAQTGGALAFHASGSVRGNVVLESRYGLVVDGTGRVEHNTVVHEGTKAALEVEGGATGRVITHNLVLVRSDVPWVRLLGDDLADDVARLDLNWYAADDGACTLEATGMALDLPGFQALTGLDPSSSCGPVPGFGAVPAGAPVDAWDEAFWSTLRPDASWERCDDPAGARGCDGEALGGAVEALEGYLEDDGHGWPGPLIVRQRYPTG
ncbi:MAG: hypothetical protein KDK70_25845, partial [Myxococcales bacterium]|nr:hypothetical protein [Myxococcales bacterium]